MSAVISQCDGFSMSFSSFINLLNVSSLGEREQEREAKCLKESNTCTLCMDLNILYLTDHYFFFRMCMVKKILCLI